MRYGTEKENEKDFFTIMPKILLKIICSYCTEGLFQVNKKSIITSSINRRFRGYHQKVSKALRDIEYSLKLQKIFSNRSNIGLTSFKNVSDEIFKNLILIIRYKMSIDNNAVFNRMYYCDNDGYGPDSYRPPHRALRAHLGDESKYRTLVPGIHHEMDFRSDEGTIYRFFNLDDSDLGIRLDAINKIHECFALLIIKTSISLVISGRSELAGLLLQLMNTNTKIPKRILNNSYRFNIETINDAEQLLGHRYKKNMATFLLCLPLSVVCTLLLSVCLPCQLTGLHKIKNDFDDSDLILIPTLVTAYFLHLRLHHTATPIVRRKIPTCPLFCFLSFSAQRAKIAKGAMGSAKMLLKENKPNSLAPSREEMKDERGPSTPLLN